MGTARTSPKVVRERRRKGVQSKRGGVKRHFNRSHRNDRHLERQAAEAKTWVAPDDSDALVERLLAAARPHSSIRDDLKQELWLRLLLGQSEAEIRSDLRSIVVGLTNIELGPWGQISLNAPRTDSGISLSDSINTEGELRLRNKVFPPKPSVSGWLQCECGKRKTMAARRCLACHRLAAYSQRVAVKTCAVCGNVIKPSRLKCSICSMRHNRLGTRHSSETRELMSKRQRELWAGEYGQWRRSVLKVYELVCRHCGFTGEPMRFARNSNCYGGRDKVCKPCMSAKTQEYKRRKREQQRVAA